MGSGEGHPPAASFCAGGLDARPGIPPVYGALPCSSRSNGKTAGGEWPAKSHDSGRHTRAPFLAARRPDGCRSPAAYEEEPANPGKPAERAPEPRQRAGKSRIPEGSATSGQRTGMARPREQHPPEKAAPSERRLTRQRHGPRSHKKTGATPSDGALENGRVTARDN